MGIVDNFEHLSEIKRWKGSNKKEIRVGLFLVCSILLYIAVWSYISIGKYVGLTATVFDLGLQIQTAWNLIHYNLGFHEYIYLFLTNALIFLFSPLSLSGNPVLFLLIQVTFLGFSAIPIYLISKTNFRSSFESLLIALSFLIFFPLSGPAFFDFHYMVFFIPFFLFGYCFYLKDRYLLSFIFFFLAGSSSPFFFAFIVIFPVVELLLIFYSNKLKLPLKDSFGGESLQVKRRNFLISLAAISLVIFIAGYFVGLTFGVNSILHINGGRLSLGGFYDTTNVFFFMLIPFFLFPIFSRWIVYFVPSYSLILLSNNSTYYIPSFYYHQYSSAVIPFIYLGAIQVLKDNSKVFNSIKRLLRFDNLQDLRKAIVIGMVFLVIIVGLYYLPYSPETIYPNYSVGSNISYNTTEYDTVIAFIELIPKNDPFVLVQNNLPQIYPRDGPDNGVVLVPGDVGPNITLSDAINNSFPCLAGGGFVKIDYVLADANNGLNFYNPVNNLFGIANPQKDGIQSMAQILQILLQSGAYKVIAEDNGIILVKRI